jgi:hypothetical protein
MGRALMTTHFDINNFRKTNNSDKQYYRQLHRLDEAGLSTESVEKAVQGSIISLANRDSRAFVIYGELPAGSRYLPTPASGALSKRMRKEVILRLTKH